jgi:hypothetical protein
MPKRPLKTTFPSDARQERYAPARIERGRQLVGNKEEKWYTGWESNPVPILKTRKLLILCIAKYARNAKNAGVGYAAGTRDDHLPSAEDTKKATNPASKRKNADLVCFQFKAT